ncbi:hypothetical protein [Planktosalinus lacus]|uniref:Chromosome partitioning protein ParA n=1 Tax=Planktosalinus lacus TaxID=1526573 RepID=A0A8J2V8E5_9FLAO|nr:hypothetical protein [Planktosalinus lacus]GGD81751.1 hypothetical protein GCM10011312_02670 [Planktosalinus lacus]
METENKKQNNSLKWFIGILALLLIALTIFTIKLYQDSQEATTNLEIQKMDIEKELEELLVNYNLTIEDNQTKDLKLLEARDRIEVLLDSVKDAQANLDLIRRYRIEINNLKSERDVLFRRADSLRIVTEQLQVEKDSTAFVLDETVKKVDSISLQNQALAEVVAKGSALKISGLKGEGVLVRNSGKIVETSRSRRADKVRTCFTINANEIAESGDRLLFIQVINPENNVLGEKSIVNFEDKILTYSTTSNIFYENEELDVCVLVNAVEDDLIEGIYHINIFDGPRLIANSTLELK